MAARAVRVPEEGVEGKEPVGGTGVSVLLVPDVTYKVLSDAAQSRGLTIAALIAQAVQAYLAPNTQQSSDVDQPSAPSGNARRPTKWRYE